MIQFTPGSQVWQLITLLSIVGEYPLGSRYLLGNKAVFKNLVHKLNRPQIFCNPETGEMITCRLLTVSGDGRNRNIRICKAAFPIGLLLAGAFNSALMLIIGLAMAGVFGFYFINRMNDLLKTRETECTAELPEIVSTMALLINAGMMLRNAWHTIAESKEGTVYELMRQSCVDMDNGMSEVDAIHKFGRLSNSAEIRKFTSALAQSIERGGSELADFLGRQSIEMWTLKKQLMLQKGEAVASKLLAPTVMLFIGIIVAVITGALGMLI